LEKPSLSPQNSGKNLIAKGSSIQILEGSSTLFEFGGSKKAVQIAAKKKRKESFNRRVAKVFANPTIFTVHNTSKKPSSNSLSQMGPSTNLSINLPSLEKELVSPRVGALSPTYLQAFARSERNPQRNPDIQERLTTLKKQALNQAQLFDSHNLSSQQTLMLAKISKLEKQQRKMETKVNESGEFEEGGSPTLR